MAVRGVGRLVWFALVVAVRGGISKVWYVMVAAKNTVTRGGCKNRNDGGRSGAWWRLLEVESQLSWSR